MHFNLQYADLLYDPDCRWRFARQVPDHGDVWKEMEFSQAGSVWEGTRQRGLAPINYSAVWAQERGLFRDPIRVAEVVVEAFAESCPASWLAATRAAIGDLVQWYFAKQTNRWAFAFATAVKPTITGIARNRQGNVRNIKIRDQTIASDGRVPRTLHLGGNLPGLPIADSHLQLRPLSATPEGEVSLQLIQQRREFMTPDGGSKTQYERLLLPVHLERDRLAIQQGRVPGLSEGYEVERRVVNLPAVYLGVLVGPPSATSIDDFFVEDCFSHFHLNEAWMGNLTWHGRGLRSFLQMNPLVCEMLVQHGVLVCE